MDNCTDYLASMSDNMTESEMWTILLQEEQWEYVTKIPAVIYMVLLMAVGVPGNVIVLLVYYNRFRMSTTKCFIMAMAVFDLCSCLVAMPFEITDIRFDFQLDIPIGCRVMRFLVAVFAYGSILVLIGVAVDRFRRVCRPYSRQMSVKNCVRGIIVITGMAVVFSCPNLIFYGRQTANFKSLVLVDCSIDDMFSESMLPKLYFVFQGFCWVLAIILLSIMYGLIIYNIKKANKRRLRLDASSASAININNMVNVGNSAGKPNNKRSANSDNVSKQTTKTASNSPTKLNDSTCMTNENDGESNPTKSACNDSKSDGRKKSWQNSESRSCNRKTNVLARLFSRDVNPVADHQDEAQGKGKAIDSSAAFATLSDQDEETPRACLQDGEERCGMEDGVSLQQLITNESSDCVVEEDGIDTMCLQEDSAEKTHEIIHTSASEGNNLNNTQKLNLYHKLLSESLQGLNDINASSSLNGFQINPCIQRSTSTGSFSCHVVEPGQLDDAAASVQSAFGQGDEDGSVSFHRSKSFPVRSSPCNKLSERMTVADVSDREGHGGDLQDKDGDICDNVKIKDTSTTDNSLLDRNSVSESQKKSESVPQCTASSQVRSSADYTRHGSGHSNVDLDISVTGKTVAHNENNDIKSTPVDSCLPSTLPTNDAAKSNRSNFQRQISVCSNNDYGYNGNNNANMASSKNVQYRRKQSTMKELKTSKLAMMMFHVTLAFVLSYLPHLSIQIAKILQPDGTANLLCDKTFFGFYHVALRSIFLNHAINPLIYGYYNKRFRQHCVSLLASPLRFFRRSSNTSSTDRTQSFSMEQT